MRPLRVIYSYRDDMARSTFEIGAADRRIYKRIMRNKLLISICVAMVLVLAVSVTAFASVEVKGPTSVTAGSTIEIVVTGTEKGLSANLATTGLEFVSVNGGLSDENTLILLEDFGGMTGTYTYKVTAANGGEVSFAMTSVTESDGQQDIPADNITWSGTVGGSFTTVSEKPTATVAPTIAPATSAPNTAAASNAAGAAASVSSDSAAVSASTAASATATAGPHTADGSSVNIWLLCIGAAACAIVAVVVGRRMMKRAR